MRGGVGVRKPRVAVEVLRQEGPMTVGSNLVVSPGWTGGTNHGNHSRVILVVLGSIGSSK